MKIFVILALLAVVWAEPEKQVELNKHSQPQARQILLYNQNALPIDAPIHHVTTQHFPGVLHERTLPRLEPQVYIYPGGAGQPFLVQPGAGPNFLIPQPQPQPGPGIVLRNEPGVIYNNNRPERPIFVAGFPKPAHIPKVNPDAEEIPTDPAAIPPFKPQKVKGNTKNEKIESFNDPEPTEKPDPGKVEHDEVDRHKKPIPNLPPVRPGQRFFILNGQQLFSHSYLPPLANEPYQPAPPGRIAYPLAGGAYIQPAENGIYLEIPPHFSQAGPNVHNFNQQPHYAFENGLRTEFEKSNEAGIQNLLLRNSVTGQIDNVGKEFGQTHPQQTIFQTHDQQPTYRTHQPQQPVFHAPPQPHDAPYFYDQPPAFKNNVFRSVLPLPINFLKQQTLQAPQQELQSRFHEDGIQLEPVLVQNDDVGLYENPSGPNTLQNIRYDAKQAEEDDDDTVVIDAKTQDDKNNEDTESEVITPPAKADEPSIAQAAPGAIALAGKGGVAASGPRGTALAGVGGLAVSSPKATAVAGPKEESSQNKKKSSKDKE